MRKILIAAAAILLVSNCGIYRKYSRPEVDTEGLFGEQYNSEDTATIAQMAWQELFTEPQLQVLIDSALARNTDLQSAWWQIQEAEASLKSARLAYIPSFNLAPEGGVSSFSLGKPQWTYSAGINASWQIDIFNSLTNAKRKAAAALEHNKAYRQAVRTQLIASVAGYYYTLLMLDEQYRITEESVDKYSQTLEAMQAMLTAGMTNSAAVAQTEGTLCQAEASLQDLKYSIAQAENSLCLLLRLPPQHIDRASLEDQSVPERLAYGVPVQILSNRPDIRQAEQSLIRAYYATAEARSALYPSIRISGSAGWTNNAGSILNPGNLLLSAAASLLQPIFNAGANRAKVRIAEAQQQEALLSFQQAVLNAGAEVNNALVQIETAQGKTGSRNRQISALEKAVQDTELMMRHSSTTYLEVLTAQQTLLSARLTAVADRFSVLQGMVSLYHALGGGTEEKPEK